MGHSVVYDPLVRAIYLFGGSKKLKWFNDVHVLDTDEWEWKLVEVSNSSCSPPTYCYCLLSPQAQGNAPTRAYHSATLYRNELWIFGGVYPQPDPHPDRCSDEIFVYSPMEQIWYSPIVKGTKPQPRSGYLF